MELCKHGLPLSADCYICLLEKTSYRPATEEEMGGITDKFAVVKWDDAAKYLSPSDNMAFAVLCRRVWERRAQDTQRAGHPPYHTYLVINSDEPYAGSVVDIMKANNHWG